MKKMFFALSAAIAALGMGAAADATVYPVALAFDGTNYTAGFSAGGLAGNFSNSYLFSPIVPISLADFSLGNVGTGVKHISFSTIKIDGINLLSYLSVTPAQSSLYGALGIPLGAGPHTLLIAGFAGKPTAGNASYSGTVNFTISPVPEPATWSMMIAGVAAVGTAMRRRARTARVAFS